MGLFRIYCDTERSDIDDANRRGYNRGYSYGINEGLQIGRNYELIHQSTTAQLNFLEFYLNLTQGCADLSLVKSKLRDVQLSIGFMENNNSKFRNEDSQNIGLLKQRAQQIKQKVSLLEQKAKS